MAKKYKLREAIPEEADEELKFYPEFTRELLWSRGVREADAAERFLNPSYDEHTYDPFLIAGMEKAVERILKAIKEEEVICIWSDYDHDGVPGGVIIHDFFKKIGYRNFKNYIPNRHIEGYGVNTLGVENLAKEGVRLIITVDVGITDVEAVDKANELGLDVIVTDHHLPGEKLPQAFAILNSKQEHCEYPDNMLCGAGVAFKLVQGLIARGNFTEKIPSGFEKWLLDLVGISTVGDMVPLLNENRVLAHYGLKVLRKTRRPGLLKLFRKIGIKQSEINEDDVGFSIVPRINAASRMDNPFLAFNLLSSAEDGETETLATKLHELNEIRKGKVASMVKEMKHTLSKKDLLSPVIVLGNPLWSPALLGISAMNLMEEYNRPVFLWGREGESRLKGSCRSDGSADLVRLMSEVKQGVLTHFGGHRFSGGFAVSDDEIYFLENHINEAYEKVKEEREEEAILIDKKLSLDEISWNLWNEISALSPFGVGNPKPIFLLENIIPEKIRNFGKRNEHLEITFRKTNGDFVRAIEFFSSRPEFKGPTLGGEALRSDLGKLNLVATLEKSTFGRYPELRLRIVDVI